MAHNNQFIGQVDEPQHRFTIIGFGVFEDRMQGRDNWHPKLSQQFDQMAASRAAENTELVLNADDIGLADIYELGGDAILG